MTLGADVPFGPHRRERLYGKPVNVVGTVYGQFGGVWAHNEARKAAGVAGAKVLTEVKLSIPGSVVRFAATHPVDDEEVTGQLVTVLEEVAARRDRPGRRLSRSARLRVLNAPPFQLCSSRPPSGPRGPAAEEDPNHRADVYRGVLLRRWRDMPRHTMWDFPDDAVEAPRITRPATPRLPSLGWRSRSCFAKPACRSATCNATPTSARLAVPPWPIA
ncbi:hypothetical protein ACFWMU_27895 [Streptomyces sp. NPDC058357]|uniref:hypothetical protein n=1 Tax=unclassified Streptomyces TaxID=2593676 RepID=UPI00365C3A11